VRAHLVQRLDGDDARAGFREQARELSGSRADIGDGASRS
jgi:hypothetical protein